MRTVRVVIEAELLGGVDGLPATWDTARTLRVLTGMHNGGRILEASAVEFHIADGVEVAGQRPNDEQDNA